MSDRHIAMFALLIAGAAFVFAFGAINIEDDLYSKVSRLKSRVDSLYAIKRKLELETFFRSYPRAWSKMSQAGMERVLAERGTDLDALIKALEEIAGRPDDETTTEEPEHRKLKPRFGPLYNFTSEELEMMEQGEDDFLYEESSE